MKGVPCYHGRNAKDTDYIHFEFLLTGYDQPSPPPHSFTIFIKLQSNPTTKSLVSLWGAFFIEY